jgi:hypothetical protein
MREYRAATARDLDDVKNETPKPRASTGGWTLMFLCAGIGLIAACVLIPEADENQKLLWQCERLRLDLEHLQKQSATNQDFIARLGNDPVIQERLAQRQLKYVRQGSGVLDIGEKDGPGAQSPFPLTQVPAAAQLQPPTVTGGKLVAMCRDGRTRTWLIGGGLLLMALGLVLGSSGEQR